MKLTPLRRKRIKIPKAVLITGGAVLLIIAVATTYVYAFKGNLFGWQAEQTTVVPDIDQGVKEDQVPENSEPSNSSLPSKDGESTVDNSDTETPTTPPEKPTIERSSGNPTITVVASFQQSSNGYCELQFSKSGQQTKSYEANITVSSMYYSCSFRVARSDLPSSGPWKLIVIHHIGGSQTVSDTVEVL